jgi:pectate lyase
MKEEMLNIQSEENNSSDLNNFNSKINYKNFLISIASFTFVVFLLLCFYNSKTTNNERTIRMLAEKIETLVPDGYASLNGGTTGGKGGKTVTVKNYKDFKNAVQSNEKLIIIVDGTIKTTEGGERELPIKSNKTIMGKDKNAKIYGGLSISNEKNVIIYNLNIEGVYPNKGGDALQIQNSATNVWVHHCTIWNAPDGNLDITKQANYITVSYCKFYYTDPKHPHRLNALISSGGGTQPNDFGYLKVTYHHNWFADNVDQRMPRIMYGEVHVYNNYYSSKNNLYCVGVGSYGSAIIEQNYFKKVKNPINFMYDWYAYILQRNNIFDGTTGTKDGNEKGVILGKKYIDGDKKDPAKITSLPYKYKMDIAKDVPSIVQKQAGPQ